MNKIGRPRKENKKVNSIRIRLSDQEKHTLELVCRETDLSISELFRTCVNDKYMEIVRNNRMDPYDIY